MKTSLTAKVLNFRKDLLLLRENMRLKSKTLRMLKMSFSNKTIAKSRMKPNSSSNRLESTSLKMIKRKKLSRDKNTTPEKPSKKKNSDSKNKKRKNSKSKNKPLLKPIIKYQTHLKLVKRKNLKRRPAK
jgi:hypothetical protein